MASAFSTVPPEPLHIPKTIKSVAGFCAFSSILISIACIFQHLKNYRKPQDQRLIVRILLLLPIYALSSWLGLRSASGSSFIDPFEEAYEALVIYTFFTLLTNLLGGERNIVISTRGRSPKQHLFPMYYFLAPVDISDPYTFLYIKRGVLQYVWIKPVLSLAILIMKLTGTYQENYIGLKSGYMWIGIIYNLSISMSLYSLALFWYCLFDDLKPFNPFPKFLCIKIIIFFSYWQGVLLSILVWLGLIHDVGYYTPNNVATAIQHTLMCTEMLGFSIGHWYAFSYKEFASESLMGFARLKLAYAARDAFGIVDLVLDFKATFYGDKYNYRQFDSIYTVLEHPDSRSRNARLAHGMRYQRGGKSKYWLPDPAATAHTVLPPPIPGHRRTSSYDTMSSTSPTKSIASANDSRSPLLPTDAPPHSTTYGTTTTTYHETPALSPAVPLLLPPASQPQPDNDNLYMSPADFDIDENLYVQARRLPYGDYNVSFLIRQIFTILTSPLVPRRHGETTHRVPPNPKPKLVDARRPHPLAARTRVRGFCPL